MEDKYADESSIVEKRRSERYPIQMKLEISSLFKQDNVKVNNIHEPIEVIDISRTGIGFISTSELPIGFYFNAKISLGDRDHTLYCVVQIVRVHRRNDDILYGCQFVGLAPVLSYIFDDFEKRMEKY